MKWNKSIIPIINIGGLGIIIFNNLTDMLIKFKEGNPFIISSFALALIGSIIYYSIQK